MPGFLFEEPGIFLAQRYFFDFLARPIPERADLDAHLPDKTEQALLALSVARTSSPSWQLTNRVPVRSSAGMASSTCCSACKCSSARIFHSLTVFVSTSPFTIGYTSARFFDGASIAPVLHCRERVCPAGTASIQYVVVARIADPLENFPGRSTTGNRLRLFDDTE